MPFREQLTGGRQANQSSLRRIDPYLDNSIAWWKITDPQTPPGTFGRAQESPWRKSPRKVRLNAMGLLTNALAASVIRSSQFMSRGTWASKG